MSRRTAPTIRLPMTLHPAVQAQIDQMGVEHSVMDCDPELADTAAFCAAYDVPLERSANAILVASKKPEGLYALCVVLATDRLDVNGTVRRKLGARKVSFATADDTLEHTGQEIGGVTVFGIPEEIPVWVDENVLAQDRVVVGAGTRSAKVDLDPEVFDRLDRFEVVPGLAKAPE